MFIRLFIDYNILYTVYRCTFYIFAFSPLFFNPIDPPNCYETINYIDVHAL